MTSPLRRRVAVPAVALAVVGALSTAPAQSAAAAPPAEFVPVSASYGASPGTPVVKGRILSYNDFHGAIDPPTGGGAVVNAGGTSTPAGGVEHLATYLKRLRAEAAAQGRQTITAGAGDLIGASPLVSAAFHDEPTIELMNTVGLQVSSVGNHEFDEGVAELIRMQRGGCHPVDGCQDGDGFGGAKFHYLAANTIDNRTGLPILPPIDIKYVGGVPVGFIGLTLEGTAGIVNPAGIKNVHFTDEIVTANRWSNILKLFGVKAQVLLLHEGGAQATVTPTAGVSDCTGFTGAVVPIVAGLNPDISIVVSGHTHRFYSCKLPNKAGTDTVVTSAGTNGQLITDIDYSLDKRTGKFTEITAKNVIVENGVPDGNGGWKKDATGVYLKNPDTVDPAAKKVADKYRVAVAPLANKVIGTISGDIPRSNNAAGESPLGDVIADAQLTYTTAATAQIALMNPGGIRADLDADQSSGGEAYGQVTYGEAFTVQPFNNLVTTEPLTGAQLKEALEQQFAGYAKQTTTKILQVSAGFTYTWSASAPLGSKVSNLALNGTPIDPAATYRVTMNNFLANGGDGFTNLVVDPAKVVTAPGFDIDALTAYLATGTVQPGPANRITTTP
ncbi:5'-nucleotidase [Actinoplanes sp. SE50]|uniref:bifunctional metallophosphatase/5'-nucleotidase n=1 Tax=unclassified Actinoplanes TaxID=2626549 RepID=UPI00023EBE67|nr:MULTISPECIES: bifunctional metallophosphatase/5'-nucleotidase [unclassified Actinoplanes]AEV81785.1 5'-nucleotidase [Actinoplanes sp. SE50/110]ATO80186.1 5'-nucleotidase [Actinoplanes sp. SE50]SLL97590.1 bifunctional metallophosphatase/5'-nucleotidase [Actinoplanes sp. SE50/110]